VSRPSVASVPGKVILLGEHAVVYGHPALAIPLDRGVLVRAEPARALRLKTVPASGAAAVQEALEELAAALGRPEVEVSIDSSIPLSAGLGSSAAVAVAMARALAGAANRTLEETELLALAERMEQRFHGRPSGIDHTTCALAVPLRFVRGATGHDVRRLRVPAMQWVVALSGPRQGTREKVAALGVAYAQEPERIGAVFASIGALAEKGATALEQGDLPTLGALMNQNQLALAGLGLSTPTIDALCASMSAAGAWGAKLTGAGGGGAVIALHPQPEILVRQLERDGVRAFVSTWQSAR
jgi:mevalonate kinase